MSNVVCICGLGNPGFEYKLNRHNVGFMVLDALKEEFLFPDFEKKFCGMISRGIIHNKSVILFKPMLFMNRSGIPIKTLSSFFKILSDEIIVVHDDLEIPFGSIKIKKGGGSGGHNGIRSIDAQISTKEYWRLKIGIGRPDENYIVADYVLNNFYQTEDILSVIKKIRLNASKILEEDKLNFLNGYQSMS